MRPSALIISVLLIGLFFTGLYTAVNDMADSGAYNLAVNETYQTSFDRTTNISQEIDNDWEDIIGNSDENETGWVMINKATNFLGFTAQATSLVKNLIKLPVVVILELISTITDFLNLPSWMSAFFTTAFLALVIFGFLALILKYRYT